MTGSPNVVALEQLNRLHPSLAALAALQHALHGFQRIELRTLCSDRHDCFLHLRAHRYVHAGQAPGNRERGAGQ